MKNKNYFGKSFVLGGTKSFGDKVENFYEAGAVWNIATFYQNVTTEHVWQVNRSQCG